MVDILLRRMLPLLLVVAVLNGDAWAAKRKARPKSVPKTDSVTVAFRLDAPSAQAVSVAGSFNGWDAAAHPLTRSGDAWSTTLRLWPGWYYYKFVVDGEWISDPRNDQRVNDGGGGFNSILKAGDPRPPVRKRSALPFPRDRLPQPILNAHPEWVDLYYTAWETAWHKVAAGDPHNGFEPRYMDEGFNEQIYQWDTCFMTLFGLYACHLYPVMPSLDNFYRRQREDGYIQRVYREDNGQAVAEPTNEEPLVNPPLFAWAEWRYYEVTGDTARLARVLPVLAAYYDWIDGHCRSVLNDGLYWNTPLGSGMDNLPRSNAERASWVDMSSQQALAARCIAGLARAAGEKELAAVYEQRYAQIAQAVNERCWSAVDSFYFDRTRGDTLSGVEHIGGFWPLAAGIADTSRAAAVIEHLRDNDRFWRPHLVPTLSAADAAYDEDGHYWRGGVWAPTNYMVVRGLRAYGARELARAVAENHLAHMAEIFLHPRVKEEQIAPEERYADGYHTIWECYAPEHVRPATRWDDTFYARQDFVGWSGLGPIAMLIEDVLGIEVDGAHNTIRWYLDRDDRHGVENLALCEQRVSLVAEPEDGRLAVQVSVETPLRLEIIRNGRKYQWDLARAGSVTLYVER